MFETAILDHRNARTRRWTMAAASMQVGVVGLILLIPLLAPERMQLLLKQASVQLNPIREAPKVKVTPGGAATTQNALTLARRLPRPLIAPRSHQNPVATIIDAPSDFLAASNIGSSAGPSAFVPNSIGSGPGIHVDVPPPPAQTTVKPAEPPGPVRIGGDVMAAKLIRRVVPAYPQIAKQARISGVVRLEGIIAKDGTIRDLRVISGPALLVRAAREAVQNWIYSPTLLNGQPVEVIAPIDVNFILTN